jgi:hypothetical protein
MCDRPGPQEIFQKSPAAVPIGKEDLRVRKFEARTPIEGSFDKRRTTSVRAIFFGLLWPRKKPATGCMEATDGL